MDQIQSITNIRKKCIEDIVKKKILKMSTVAHALSTMQEDEKTQEAVVTNHFEYISNVGVLMI